MTAPTPPAVDVPELVEPGPAPDWREETSAECARLDRYWFNRDED